MSQPVSFRPPLSTTRIALALSGGGFRASIFHLGVLKRIAELGWLEAVVVRRNCVGHKFAASTCERKGIISRHPSNRSQIRSFPATDRGAPDIDTRREPLPPFRASQCRQTVPAVRQARRSMIG